MRMLEDISRQYIIFMTHTVPAVDINVIQDFLKKDILLFDPFPFCTGKASLKVCFKTEFLDLFDLCLCLLPKKREKRE